MPYRASLPMASTSHSADTMHIMVGRHHDGRGSLAWRVGRPRRAAMWPSGSGSSAIPSATGARAMPRAAGRPCGTSLGHQAHPSRSPQTCRLGWSRPCGSRLAWPRTRPCGSGASHVTHWTSRITRSTRASAPDATPSARCRGPVTPKTPEAIGDFQVTCQARLQRVRPPEHTRPVRVFSQDDSRLGWLTVRRRRLTADGVQPVGAVHQVFAGFSGDGAGAPTTGARCGRE
jgi:hypothetical protein